MGEIYFQVVQCTSLQKAPRDESACMPAQPDSHRQTSLAPHSSILHCLDVTSPTAGLALIFVCASHIARQPKGALAQTSSPMDPFMAMGFAAAILQLIDVTTKAVKYLNHVKDAPKEQAKLAREVASLLPLLIDLRYEAEEAKSTEPWFGGLQSLGGVYGPLMEFKETMEKLAAKLEPTTGIKKISRSLCWTLDKDEVNGILSKVERLKTLVGLVLQRDHLYGLKTFFQTAMTHMLQQIVSGNEN